MAKKDSEKKESKVTKKTVKKGLKDVETLAKEKGLKGWELAALRQATGWIDGKQVTDKEFDAALERLRGRRQGSGKI